MPNGPETIEIVEVGPRDGLQNEQQLLTTEGKVELINGLVKAGVKRLEVTSFVSPKWVPQMADAVEVMRQITLHEGVMPIVLIPNEKGYERARTCQVSAVAIVVGASNTFNQKNINMTTEASLRRLRPLVQQMKQDGVFVRAYIATAFGCPYEGEVPLERVQYVMDAFLEMGADEIDVADTIGIAHPRQVFALFTTLKTRYPDAKITAHFHDTRGLALANTIMAIQAGITSFDASIGGLGGCPFAKGASGNVATEDIVYMLERMGFATGVDMAKLTAANRYIAPLLHRSLARPAHQLIHEISG